MSTRNHNNRSEKQKGHQPVLSDNNEPHSSDAGPRSRGDGGGGAPRQQGQGQANEGVDNRKQNRGHG